MNDKAGPIAGVVGLLALIGVTATVMRSSSDPLARQVDDFIASSQNETPAERHADIAKRIAEAQALVDDPMFAKLDTKRQDVVHAHLAELVAFRGYVEALDKITPPRETRKDEQLRAIKSSLTQLKAPIEYQVEWSQTEAGQRQRQWLAEADALEKAVDGVANNYQKVYDEASALLKDSEGANLPARARKILDEANRLPAPESDGGKAIAGAPKVTYGTVFAFSRVDFVYDKWKKQREKLERLAALGKS